MSAALKTDRRVLGDFAVEDPDILHYQIALTADQAYTIIATRMAPNRSLPKAKQKEIAAQIQDGKWIDTGEAIVIDSRGKVIDGQTRLQAIYLAGSKTPVRVSIAQHLKHHKDLIHLIDVGTPRTGKHSLEIDRIANPAVVVRVIRLFYMYLTAAPRTKSKLPNYMVAGFIKEYPELESAVKRFKEFKNICWPVAAIILFMLQENVGRGRGRTDASTVAEFIEFMVQVENGQGAATSAAGSLGKLIRSVRENNEGHSYRMERWLGYYIAAWNMHLAGEAGKEINFCNGMQFPSVVQGKFEVGDGLPASLVSAHAKILKVG